MEFSLFDAKRRLDFLRKEIRRHDELYYIKNASVITDQEYDELRVELGILEEKYPELQKSGSASENVGFEPGHGFAKIKHSYPMLSINNVFSESELGDFFTRIKKLLSTDSEIEFQCEPKIDGLSFSAYYKNGNLEYASTRGDGMFGEDVTANIKTIDEFPLHIGEKIDLEVRGEVYMGKGDFLTLNEENEKVGKQTFSNPRNAASGSLRQLDSGITKERKLKYFVWGGRVENIKTQNELMNNLKSFGFIVNPHVELLTKAEDVLSYYEKMCSKRAELDYDIDGLVYKTNDIKTQNILGNTARSPRWAVAHKFPAEHGKTKVNDIKIQIGRTGAVTPVAILESVNLGGVLVTRASLHNEDEIIRNDVRIGDIVVVRRAGDVIPQIIKVDMDLRKPDVKKFNFPTHCPVCNSEIKGMDGDVIKRCMGGIKCKAQVVERLSHFVSKNAFDIVGLSGALVQFFYDKLLIKDFVDIFTLKEKDAILDVSIEQMHGFGEKSVKKLFDNIEKARNIDFNRFIYSLGIRHVGFVNSSVIANHFDAIDDFLNLVISDDAKEKLMDLNGVGEVIAQSVVEFFLDQYNMKLIQELVKEVHIKYDDDIKLKRETIIYNKKIVFTGSLENYSRLEAENLAKKMGAKISKSVSKETDILVIGKDPGSKLSKAEKLEISIMSEESFNLIIGDNIYD
ncbi:MAG: DNA ligase (NAD+) [Candidatus Midichloriaceae bacterium]|jgi:DNA ligase (NAD+)